LFARHRADLKDAHEAHVRSLNALVDVLAEQVEYLRGIIAQQQHLFPQNLRPLNPSGLVPVEGVEDPMYMSEEEEEILALRQFDHITDQDVERLRGELGLQTLRVFDDE
jgi:hypothetical protein